MDEQSQRIVERASEFFARRHGETPSQRRQREAWLADDPRHAAAYERTQRVWDRLGSVSCVLYKQDTC